MASVKLSVNQRLQEEQRKLSSLCAKVFVCGGIGSSIASLIDSNANLFTAWDNYLTAIVSPLYIITGLLIFFRPQWLFGAVMLSLIPSMIYHQGVMIMAIHFPTAASLYSATSSGPFVPLFYVAAFITLPKGGSTICWIQCAGFYLQFLLNTFVFFDPAPSPERQTAEHFLIEIMMAHPAYVLALNYIVKLRERVYSIQQDSFESKQSFLAMMSHEIRNQMQTMLGAIEFLDMKLTGSAERRSINRLHKSATQLQTYLSDINELAKLENPQLRFENKTIDLRCLLDDICEEWQQIAVERGLQLSLEAPSLKIETDEVRLRQIVSNLVSNALKYTKSGSVRVRAGVSPESSGIFYIEVVDTGIGIDNRQIADIFRPHIRLENARECCDEGSGLGLSIVERLVDSFHGSLQVESELNHGSRFRVILPISLMH